MVKKNIQSSGEVIVRILSSTDKETEVKLGNHKYHTIVMLMWVELSTLVCTVQGQATP